ncbi:DUF2637 domain-containing protein [Micromonospora sp. NBC_00362]|uniref:DUF2637 domain-containing protein n=1 Tax=Micromonospora sp. NBC_00362 TaxID=2975975 RepID=UPI0022564582|nr:DUF2637 domain-containing protein [Micromonospora sp. NBC_00362]MCX5122022.1 DUF2637 domain-containing protein [Micromonospora sp. NBC_00362]
MSTTTAPVAHTGAGERELRQLRQLRWGVRTVLALGIAASIAANVLHARPNPISQVISAWPPLALMLTVELISRVPTHKRLLAAVRMLAATPIAAIAAWVSYWHMAGVAARYGETEAAAEYLLPLSVDGLVVVASVSLVEITGRLRAAAAPQTAGGPAPDAAGHSATIPTSSPAEEIQSAVLPADLPPCIAAAPPSPSAQAPPAERRNVNEQPKPPLADPSTTVEASDRPKAEQVGVNHHAGAKPNTQTPHHAAVPATDPAGHTPPAQPHGDLAASGAGDHDAAVPTDTATAVAYWHRRDPGLHPAQIATRIGRSERTVRRYWPPSGGVAPRTNGNRVRTGRR